MKYNLFKIFIISFVLAVACNPDWDEHYYGYQETIDDNVWNAMQSDPAISQFVQFLEENELDTLFTSDIPYTVFVPTNEATEAFMDAIDSTLLKYHIYSHVINTSNIVDTRKVQSLTKKFVRFERQGMVILIDGVVVESESPLYRNGKYLTVNEVITPTPNLYEFYRKTNPILSDFRDRHDSVVLDRELSIPIGYDENDNTVYDSVKNIINTFDQTYFNVNNEFRDKAATIVFPLQEDYYTALTNMAENLGFPYTDYNDIPLDWQNSILLPYLIDKGIFANLVEPEEFRPASPDDTYKLLNILGDSVIIDYTASGKEVCSNGYAYNYENFQIPESLYSGEKIIEGEYLTDQIGINKYAWKSSVNVQSGIEFQPIQEYVNTASNDSILKVLLPNGYADEFSIEFSSPKLFPRKYVLEIRTNMDIGGVYDIYINNELVKTFDYQEFITNDGFIFSVEPGGYYLPDGRFNSFDMYLENIVEYGSAIIRIEYKGQGGAPSSGLVLDYLKFR